MALLWHEGFEGIGATPGDANASLALKYTTANLNANSGNTTSGRVTGTSFRNAGVFSVPSLTTISLGNLSTVIVGFAWQRSSSFVAHQIITLLEGSNVGVNLRLQATTGEFDVYMNNTLLGSTSGAALSSGTWAYFELKVKTDNTTGTVELKINGTSVLSLTGKDTEPGSNAYINSVAFKFQNGSNTSTTFSIFDDIYICDTTGTAQNDYLGDVYIQGMLPDGAGSSTQFTPDSGNNYARVNEGAPDGDTSYVESSTSGNKDLYSYANTSPTITNTIIGIQVNTTAKNGSGTFTLKSDCKSGSTTSADAGTALTSSYQTLGRTITLDPDTSGSWTPTNLNAAEFGFEVA